LGVTTLQIHGIEGADPVPLDNVLKIPAHQNIDSLKSRNGYMLCVHTVGLAYYSFLNLNDALFG
jgi:hypothetical protein